MAMHALAEGYLIKGDFGQAEWGDKLRILRFFPFFFCWKKWMNQTNLSFFEKKYVILHVFVFGDYVFFSLEKYKKETNKQLDFEKKVGYISFIPNLVWISQLVLKFFHCTPRRAWHTPKPTSLLSTTTIVIWQAMDAAEEAQQKEGDDQILEAPETWEGLVTWKIKVGIV